MRKFLFTSMLCMGIGGHFYASADVAKPLQAKPLNNKPKVYAPKTIAAKPTLAKPSVAKPILAKRTIQSPLQGAKINNPRAAWQKQKVLEAQKNRYYHRSSQSSQNKETKKNHNDNGAWQACCPVTVSELTNIIRPPQETTDITPFIDQTFTNLGGRGRIWRNNEVEPSLAINPKNPCNIVAFFQQDRWSDGGADAVRVRYSKDGGNTWNDPSVPFSTTRFQNPPLVPQHAPSFPYDRASDPWIRFGSDGIVHAIWESEFFLDPNLPNSAIEDHYHSRSLDGGKTWSSPVLIAESNTIDRDFDKSTITLDPIDPNIIYFTVTNFKSFLNPPFGVSFPGMFTRSTDGGQTWEPIREVASFPNDPTGNVPNEAFGTEVAAFKDGTLLYIYGTDTYNSVFTGSTPMEFVRSSNRGITWDPTHYKIGDIIRPSVPTPGVFENDPADYELGIAIRAQATDPSVAVNHKKDIVYVAWQDSRYNTLGQCGSVVTFSKDKGNTWSNPIPVNPTSLDVQAFLPTVAVLGDGRVAVMFYDFRFDVPNDNQLTTDVWVSIFDKDLTKMLQQVRVTPQSFDLRQSIIVSNSFFLGDYVDIQAMGKHDLGALFIRTNQLGIFPPVFPPPATVIEVNHQDPVFTKIFLNKHGKLPKPVPVTNIPTN